MIKKLFRRLFSNREHMSFKQAFDLTSMPIITFSQGDIKLNFILDTGSQNNVIDSNILDKIKHEKEENSSILLYGMEGVGREVSKCTITLFYKEKEYYDIFLANNMQAPFDEIKKNTGVTLHGILGAKFFDKYKYVLDFNEMIAYSKA